MILSLVQIQPNHAISIQVAKHGACLQINVRNLSDKELVVPEPDSDGLVANLRALEHWKGRKPDKTIYDFPLLANRSYWRIPPKLHKSTTMKISTRDLQPGLYEGTIFYDDSRVESRVKETRAGVTKLGKSRPLKIRLSIDGNGACRYIFVKASK